MTEWGVVVVIIALFGFIVAVVSPIVKLNASIVRLTTLMDVMSGDFSELTSKNSDAHKRLWEKNTEQDNRISNNEQRIGKLEGIKK